MWLSNQKDIDDVLKELDIIPLPKSIMDMSMAEIRKYFAYASGGIIMGMLMKNLIWQIYKQIKAENPPDFVHKQSNIRGMWYYIKKKLTQHHPLRGDHYSLMIKSLTLMVKAGLFSYKAFNFRDPGAGTWKLGFQNPHIILMGEKDGFITVMEDLNKSYGCHIVTAGGVPSFMTVNYMVASMKSFEIDLQQPFYVFSFSDFDPSGYNIAETFVQHLNHSGLRNTQLFNQWGAGKKQRPWLELAVPTNFQRPIKEFWYTIPKATWNDPSTEAWVKLTGGLDGSNWKPGKITHGLESDEFNLEEIKLLFSETLKPYLKTPSTDVIKIAAMQDLRQNLENMMVIKILEDLLGTPPKTIFSSIKIV